MPENKTEERGLASLSVSSVSLPEQLEALAKEISIRRTMGGVISDHHDNIHAQSGSMLPERSNVSPPAPKGTGWIDPRPLEPPPGISTIDNMVKAFEEEERRAKK